jgi:hypothetical protein
MTGAVPPSPHGLCGSCVFAERTGNKRGSEFILCGLSRTDPSYPKYPRLPVLACAGYRREPDKSATDSSANEEP